MELEERDANMKDVRLEFILNNQKKMQAQQKFLQQQLDKDLRQLATSMHKTELELKKDQLVSSSAAIGRLQDLHKIMSDSLKYTKRLVSFMVFD